MAAASARPARGSTFTVRLPARAAPSDEVPAVASIASSVRPSQSLDGLSVLVVDDNRESREIAAAHLTSRQAAVWTAESPPEAMEILQRERIDVILADIAMPGEDGYSFIKRVRALNATAATTPAAALTALAREEDRRRALEAGFQLHLAKPIDGESLVAAVAGLGRRPLKP